MPEDIIFLDKEDVDMYIDIPDFFGALTRYKIIWIRHLHGNYCEVSLRSDDFGFTTWLVYINEDKSITPISCTMYFSPEEAKKLRLGDSLHMNLHDKILNERITEHGRK